MTALKTFALYCSVCLVLGMATAPCDGEATTCIAPSDESALVQKNLVVATKQALDKDEPTQSMVNEVVMANSLPNDMDSLKVEPKPDRVSDHKQEFKLLDPKANIDVKQIDIENFDELAEETTMYYLSEHSEICREGPASYIVNVTDRLLDSVQAEMWKNVKSMMGDGTCSSLGYIQGPNPEPCFFQATIWTDGNFSKLAVFKPRETEVYMGYAVKHNVTDWLAVKWKMMLHTCDQAAARDVQKAAGTLGQDADYCMDHPMECGNIFGSLPEMMAMGYKNDLIADKLSELKKGTTSTTDTPEPEVHISEEELGALLTDENGDTPAAKKYVKKQKQDDESSGVRLALGLVTATLCAATWF